MFKNILLLAFLVAPFSGVIAQAKKDSANDLNAYFKPVKWRNIGPFRGEIGRAHV